MWSALGTVGLHTVGRRLCGLAHRLFFLSLPSLKKAMPRLPQRKIVSEALPSVEHARRHAHRTTSARRSVGDGQQQGSDTGRLVMLGVRPAAQRQWIPLCNRHGQDAVRVIVLDGRKRGDAARRKLLLAVRRRGISARALVMKIGAGRARSLGAGMRCSYAAAPPRVAAGLT